MAEASHGQVACPHCHKQYRWKPDLAGRKVVCKCGQKMRLPTTADGRIEPLGPPPAPADPNEASTYDLEVPDEPPAPTPAAKPSPAPASRSSQSIHLPEPEASPPTKCPSCNQPLKPGAVLCVNCGYSLESGEQLETAVAEAPEDDEADDMSASEHASSKPSDNAFNSLADTVRSGGHGTRRPLVMSNDSELVDRHLPFAMFAIGIATCLLLGIWTGDSFADGLISGGIFLGLQLFIMMPLLLLAIYMTAHIVGINFGYLGTATLKLSAICVGPGALGDSVAMLLLPFFRYSLFASIFIAGLIYLIFLGIPLSIMFKLDSHETIMTVAVAIVVRMFSFLLILATLFAFLT